MVFGNPRCQVVKPGYKNQYQDNQGENNSHHQPAEPDAVNVSFVVNIHC
jgi:hypothetical protein